MAYSDYGALVYCNGTRRTDKEDAPLFATDEEAFGEDINNIPSGLRIWANILHIDTQCTKDESREDYIRTHIAHGVLGDGDVRVRCYKQGLPTVWEQDEFGELQQLEFTHDSDPYHYGIIRFTYKGYTFNFVDAETEGNHYVAEMITPDGEEWSCDYDYEFGAGFEEE